VWRSGCSLSVFFPVFLARAYSCTFPPEKGPDPSMELMDCVDSFVRFNPVLVVLFLFFAVFFSSADFGVPFPAVTRDNMMGSLPFMLMFLAA